MKEEATLLTLKENMSGEKNSNFLFKKITPNKLAEKFNKPTQNNELWLEKYKPMKFCDLLTEEKTNREILIWLKSWDEIVFGKKFTLPQKSNKKNKLNEFNSNSNSKLNFDQEIDLTQSSHKIILISGPPGIGKTTLAKVIASHCGYETIVINASDERTSEKLLSRIYDTTQIHNLNFAKKENQNPTCLILDEIDGVFEGADGKNAIQNIMEFIKYGTINKNITEKLKKNIFKDNNDFNKNQNKKENLMNLNLKDKKAKKVHHSEDEDEDEFNEEDDKKSKQNNQVDKENSISNKKKNNYVKRPIICICNDLYAKVLINLRKEALIFNIKKANPLKLLNRLKEICSKENLNIDTRALKNLCDKSNYDIRVSVNTLEFLSHNKNNIALFKSISNGEKLSILGQKDITEGVFGIWAKLFSISIEKCKYNSILDIYSSHGDYNVINDGIFVNYLKVNNKEKDLASRAKLLDYLSYDDTIQKYINSTFNYEMATFQGIPGAYAKKKYSTSERVNLEFTTTLIEMKKNKKQNNQIIKSIKASHQEENFSLKMSKNNFTLDLLPYLFQLIQPDIREINTDLMSKKELIQLYNTISLMHTFGIKFNNSTANNAIEENEQETPIYEPDLQRLLFFHFVNNVNARISEKQKLIIKNEYEKYKSFREAKKIIKGLENLNFSTDVMERINSNKINLDSNIDSEKNKNRNYFKLGNKRTFTQMNEQHSSKFIYKYNEGLTNSVRRNLNISYFSKTKN